MVASDGILHGTIGHPRVAGTFARVLGHYVREAGALTLMDALRKMTIEPARRLTRRVPGMSLKGRLQLGADADIVVFDAAQIIDRATYREPTLPPDGLSSEWCQCEAVSRSEGPRQSVAGLPGEIASRTHA